MATVELLTLWIILFTLFRSSRPEVFCKKGIFKNFAKFTGKHLCQSIFLKKVATLFKKRLWYKCFPMNFAKVLRTPIFIRTPLVAGCFCLFLILYNYCLVKVISFSFFTLHWWIDDVLLSFRSPLSSTAKNLFVQDTDHTTHIVDNVLNVLFICCCFFQSRFKSRLFGLSFLWVFQEVDFWEIHGALSCT